MKIKDLKTSYWFLALIWAFLPLSAHALSIGKLETRSTYGQPLNATIGIPAYTSSEIDSLTVKLAGQDAYEAAGLDWLKWFSDLSLTLRFDENNKPYIAIRSSVPINELALSLIIEFDWKGGHTVRQFDTLLSPMLPLKDKQTTPTAQTTTDEATATEKETVIAVEQNAPRQQAEIKPLRQVRPRATLTDLGNGNYTFGPILPGQTLSSVAEKFASKTQLDFNQRMQILFQLNRHAFSGNSFGSLKAGYVLRFSEHAKIDDVEPMEEVPGEKTSSFSAEPQSNSTVVPDYEENVDSIRQFGQVVRMEKQPEEQPPSEAQLLQQKLAKTRKDVENYRQTNNELRARLSELETTLKQQADQLGIIVPDPLPVNIEPIPQTQSSLAQ